MLTTRCNRLECGTCDNAITLDFPLYPEYLEEIRIAAGWTENEDGSFRCLRHEKDLGIPDQDRNLFAWCFSHGAMHCFIGDDAWCTADWIRLKGTTAEEARGDHLERFHGARFEHDLPQVVRGALEYIRW